MISPVDVLLLVAVAYLIYKVTRLERLLESRFARREARHPADVDGKVIPILKDEIEPGPFKRGNAKQDRQHDE
jgi:hypothetical protein